MPIHMFGKGGGSRRTSWSGPQDWRGVVAGLAISSAVGAAGGLVTGVMSDINILAGATYYPFRNIDDPFATNTSSRSIR